MVELMGCYFDVAPFNTKNITIATPKTGIPMPVPNNAKPTAPIKKAQMIAINPVIKFFPELPKIHSMRIIAIIARTIGMNSSYQNLSIFIDWALSFLSAV
jgi:hypothetical protein